MTHGGKRPGAGRPRKGCLVQIAPEITRESRALLDQLQLVLGGSQGDVIAEALRALDRELRRPAKKRKGARAVVV